MVPRVLSALHRSYHYSKHFVSHCYYIYSEELAAVLPSELCCHTLLVDNNTEYRSHSLLLLSNVDVNEDELRTRRRNMN